MNQSLMVMVDWLLILTVALFAIFARFPRPLGSYSREERLSIEAHLGCLVLYSVLVLLFAHTQRLYSRFGLPSTRRDAAGLLKSISVAALVLTGFIYVSQNQTISRFVIGATIAASFLAMLGWRCLRRHWLRTAAADGLTRHNALIVGSADVTQTVTEHLERHRELGLSVKGFLSDTVGHWEQGCLGGIDDFERVVRAQFIDELIVCGHDRELLRSLFHRAQACGVSVRAIPDLYDGLAMGAPVDYLGEIPSMYLHCKSIPAIALLLKRAIDLLISGIALLVLAPAFLLLACVIRLDSAGPVLYESRRVGRKGQIFSCYKFRTMVTNAEEIKENLRHLNERDGVLFKISNDPRITRTGGFLRKYSVDELAQLWNVFRGDMSLVGPRPPLADEVERYQLDHLRRLEVPPGITGLWQVEARNNPSFERYIELDLKYVRDWNLLLDLKIIFKTVAVVIAGTGR